MQARELMHVCLESVEKKCGYNGRWEGQNGTSNEEYLHGWANYTTCLTPEMLRLHGKVYTNTIEGNVSIARYKPWKFRLGSKQVALADPRFRLIDHSRLVHGGFLNFTGANSFIRTVSIIEVHRGRYTSANNSEESPISQMNRRCNFVRNDRAQRSTRSRFKA
ncbi:hypothetical protein K0M31_008206 [Melipona bicolor]|uniref:Uncharacterized protein n=1 Tax=Melipona bicolor TaxID=60889 RepID=A0AA40FQI4_9HYME|nr:hypothetical protein K0M31_008206 [Melipona bicolor]